MDKNDLAISSRSTDFKLVHLIYTLTVHRCLDKTISFLRVYVIFADGPLGPSALTLDNWMLLSQNG